MISAGVIFTNDRFPRATTPDLRQLRTSDPDEHTLPTLVREGATIGAGCTIGCDLVIGRFAMVGMGSVVTNRCPTSPWWLAIRPARRIRLPLRRAVASFSPMGAPDCGRTALRRLRSDPTFWKQQRLGS